MLLPFVGMDDTVRVSEDASEVGITGEITAFSPLLRPTVEAGPSVGVGSLSNEVADFLKEFDRRCLILTPSSSFGVSIGLWCPLAIFRFQTIARLICCG